MGYAIYVLLVGILGGSLGGVLVTSLICWRLYRRCTSLEWAVGDLQQRASTFKGREMADKRWKKAEAVDEQMAQALHTSAPPRTRYDNDPMV